jgi:hypothetical protein
MSSGVNLSGVIVPIVIASIICLVFALAYIVQAKSRRKKKMTCAVETPAPSTIPTRNLDVELQSGRITGQPSTRIGEAYTIKGHEVRLAYHQELPRRLLDIQDGASNIPLSSAPAHINGRSSNLQNPDAPGAASSPPTHEQTVVLTSDETTAAILALQQEVHHLRIHSSQPMSPLSQNEDPFNPLPVVRRDINAPPESTPQERALRTQLEVLRAEVERLQAENAVLVLAGPSSPPAYRPE